MPSKHAMHYLVTLLTVKGSRFQRKESQLFTTQGASVTSVAHRVALHVLQSIRQASGESRRSHVSRGCGRRSTHLMRCFSMLSSLFAREITSKICCCSSSEMLQVTRSPVAAPAQAALISEQEADGLTLRSGGLYAFPVGKEVGVRVRCRLPPEEQRTDHPASSLYEGREAER